MMKIEEGGFYIKRNGKIIGPAKRLEFSESFAFWFPSEVFRPYHSDGNASDSGCIESKHDLIARVLILNRDILWDDKSESENDATAGVIYYQQKGYINDLHYKTFLWSESGIYCEGIGETLEASIRDLIGWLEYLSSN